MFGWDGEGEVLRRPGIDARDGYILHAPVGRFRQNAFGLFDMHGNVWEWCSDGYDADYYKWSPMHDPPGPVGTTFRISRGGSWADASRFCRSADRWISPEQRGAGTGFRVALGVLIDTVIRSRGRASTGSSTRR